MHVRIAKVDDGLQVVWGYASVIEEQGKPVIDAQGDLIESDELVKAAHDFVSSSRTGGLMHIKDQSGKAIQVGEVVESIVLTKDLQSALGIDLGRVGWFVGMHVPDPAIWSRIKSGELQAFSIGGSGLRTPTEVD